MAEAYDGDGLNTSNKQFSYTNMKHESFTEFSSFKKIITFRLLENISIEKLHASPFTISISILLYSIQSLPFLYFKNFSMSQMAFHNTTATAVYSNIQVGIRVQPLLPKYVKYTVVCMLYTLHIISRVRANREAEQWIVKQMMIQELYEILQ